MSLQIWLPFVRDTENQGLALSATSNQTLNEYTAATAGKLGGAYSGYAIYHAASEFLGNQWSVATWVSSSSFSANNNIIFCKNGSSSNDCQIYWSIVSNTRFNIGINGPSSTTDYSYTFATNTWYHLATTYDGATIKMYINGELVKTVSYTSTLLADKLNICIGCRSATANGTSKFANAWGAKYNDLRLYDHALSAKEVRELAKGLVLHYKLDENLTQLNNCYATPKFQTSASGGGWSHWARSGAIGSYGQNTDKQYIYDKSLTYSHWVSNSSTATAEYLLHQSPAFEGGHRSLQCICKEENGARIDESVVFPAWNARSGGVPNNKWTSISSLGSGFYLCKCEDIQQDGSNDLVGFYVCPGYKVYFSEAYLENDRTICSDIFNQGFLNVVHDSSGFGYNGTPANVETLSDSPRYLKSTHFTGSTSKIHIPNLLTSGFSTTYTFAWWGKTNSWSNKMFWGFQNGTRLNLYNGIYWNTGDGSSDPIYIPGTTTTITAPSLNVWHHYVMTCDGTSCLLYLDGVLYGQAKTVKSITGTDIWFNGWDSGGSYTLTDMSMVDFRIYSTALSADDILELYHTSASIDKSGSIYARELVE